MKKYAARKHTVKELLQHPISHAIGIKLRRGSCDESASKFFGAPFVPEEWADLWPEDVIFLCQIRLSDIADLDTGNRLPHTGYLYIFIDTESYPYTPLVYHFDGEPNVLLEGFNESVKEFSHLTEAKPIDFEETEENAPGMKLFGTPFGIPSSSPLLLQYAPATAGMEFLHYVDGYIYFFWGENEKDYSDVTMKIGDGAFEPAKDF